MIRSISPWESESESQQNSNMKKIFLILIFCFVPLIGHAAFVEKTADTATAAKTAALTEARRTEFINVLSGKVSSDDAQRIAATVSDSDLVAMTDSMSIDNEKVSDTTYSADISFQFNQKAIAGLTAGSQPATTQIGQAQTITPTVGANQTVVYFQGVRGLDKWLSLMKVMRANGASINIKSIFGKNITATVDSNSRAGFISAMRSLGMTVSDYGNVIYVM